MGSRTWQEPGDTAYFNGTVVIKNLITTGDLVLESDAIQIHADAPDASLAIAADGSVSIPEDLAPGSLTVGLARAALDTLTSALHIRVDASTTQHATLLQTANDTSHAVLGFNKSRATDGSANVAVQNGDYLGRIIFYEAAGGNWREAAWIGGLCDGTVGSGDSPGALAFSTTPDGSSTAATRMTIGNAGNVAIGTSSRADAELLYVKAGDDGLAVDADSAANLILEGSGANYISIRNPDANDSGIRFNVGTDADASSIDHVTQFGTDYFRFKVAGTNVLYVTSSPAVLINSGSRADAETLYVKAGDDGITVNTHPGINMILEDSSTNYLAFRAPTNIDQGLIFNGSTDADANGFFCTYTASGSYFTWKIDTASVMTLSSTGLKLPSRTDANRGAAGVAGKVIFNTDDGKLNIDDGTNWTLPDGTVT